MMLEGISLAGDRNRPTHPGMGNRYQNMRVKSPLEACPNFGPDGFWFDSALNSGGQAGFILA